MFLVETIPVSMHVSLSMVMFAALGFIVSKGGRAIAVLWAVALGLAGMLIFLTCNEVHWFELMVLGLLLALLGFLLMVVVLAQNMKAPLRCLAPGFVVAGLLLGVAAIPMVRQTACAFLFPSWLSLVTGTGMLLMGLALVKPWPVWMRIAGGMFLALAGCAHAFVAWGMAILYLINRTM